MKNKQAVFRLRNALMFVPAWYLIMRFENQVTALLFAITIAFITSRMFPLVELQEQDSSDENNQGPTS